MSRAIARSCPAKRTPTIFRPIDPDEELLALDATELVPLIERTLLCGVPAFLRGHPGIGKSDIARLTREVEALERDTGMKLRVLAQAYPQTPGLAVKEYWNVDDDTVVFIADPGLGNILNFSVGSNVDLEIPPSFWTRLANKYGTKFYWSDKGEEASISAAVNAVDACAREPPGRAKCSKITDYDDGVPAASSGGFLGGLFK